MKLESMVYLMVAGLIVGALSVPIIGSLATSTNVYENELPEWVRLAYVEDATTEDYTFNVAVSGDTVSVGSLSGSSDVDTVIYADANGALYVAGGAVVYMTEDGTNALGDNVSVTNTAGQLTVSDGVNSYVRDSPEWAYYPQAGGSYATYSAGDLLTNNKPLAVGGYFAGVLAYNGIVFPDYGLVIDADTGDGVINSVNWVKEE